MCVCVCVCVCVFVCLYMCVYSVGSMVENGIISVRSQHVTVTGLIIMLTYCLISALAGVYTEYILKKDLYTPLHLQNMMLYSFSISINFVGWYVTQIRAEAAEEGKCFFFFPPFFSFFFFFFFSLFLSIFLSFLLFYIYI